MESTPALGAMSVSPTSLAAGFAQVPDPRRAASLVDPLPALLTMAVAALLANHRSVLAIAEWGAREEAATLVALGFPDGRTPCQSTRQRLFRHRDGDALAARWTGCFALSAGTAPPERAGQGVAVAGKAQRGRLRFAPAGCAVHALSAFCHDGIVLAHEPIAGSAATAAAELTVAPALAARIDWCGRVLTGDALFCQRTLCRQVLDAGGEYLLVVKENQGMLSDDIRLLFDPPAARAAASRTDRRVARTVENGHGRPLERRELVASTDLTAYLDWPGVVQGFRLERTGHEQRLPKRVCHYGITSLPPAQADAPRLLALRRGHGTIANRLHRGKDVTFGEDASLIRVGQGPTVMPLLRAAAVNMLSHAGVRRVASCLRRHSQHPDLAVALLLVPLPTGA